jgi:hypothetical protein
VCARPVASLETWSPCSANPALHRWRPPRRVCREGIGVQLVGAARFIRVERVVVVDDVRGVGDRALKIRIQAPPPPPLVASTWLTWPVPSVK